jgi:D-alanine--poly(phosphoribitol) ligase subunit 2
VIERRALVDLIVEKVHDLVSHEAATQPGFTEDTVLLGADGQFDSLGLVTLLIDVEDTIAETTGVEITLSDDRAVSSRSSPFRTVGTLADYVINLLGRHAAV